jgi:hypothetical protein
MLQSAPASDPTLDPAWLQLLERLGLPIFLILFGCAVVWKLLPYVLEWFKQGTVSARIVAEAVPDIKDSLHRMAGSAAMGEQRLNQIEQRTVVLERHTEEILRRLPD